jgi:putative CocE/NonD family hydrolase
MRFGSSGRVRTRICEAVQTRDGTHLSADVYLPPQPGRYPALVTMTPYDNNRSPRVQGGSEAIQAKADVYRLLADSGYVVVAVDVRGRGDSDGSFVPFVHEAADGADVITWTRGLAECSGRVGVFGAGYAGYAGIAAALGGGVDAVYAVSPLSLGAEGLVARNGALRLEWLFWMHLVAGRTVQPADVPLWDRVFESLPISAMHEVLGRDNIWWSDWIRQLDPDDDLWAPLRDVVERLGTMSVPMLLQTGWWDACQSATLAYWQSATTTGPAALRELVVGPWGTASTRNPSRHDGGLDFGAAASVDATDLLLDWFDEQLDQSASRRDGTRVRVFETGSDRWIDLASWPPESESRSLWLSSEGRANTRAGDGWLIPQAPGPGQHPDGYSYDPARPARWQPGAASFSRNGQPLVLDESHLTTRDDVLVYTTKPAEAAWSFVGACRLVLYAETDAPDTDWIATLSDVFPDDGSAIHLAHAAVRARTNAEFKPGVITKFTLTFSDIAHSIQVDHALRLTVTSSLFPLYARNPNAPDYLDAVETKVAQQRIHHDDSHPSRLHLPVVTGPAAPARTARTGWFP